MDSARRHCGLNEVFLFGVLHAGAQDLVHRERTEDDAFTTAFIRWLDDEMMTERRQIEIRNHRLVDEWRQKHCVGRMNAGGDQLKLHRCLIFRPFGDFGRIDAPDMMFT